MEHNNIRNFCIIAHIDHGKSTLADRLLEITGTVEKRHMKEQLLDQMDIERERGITIKLAPVRMNYKLKNVDYILNLIDTPGHVDFAYEVSRSLAAVEGAVLLVDATQGVQAQTINNLNLALEQNLVIIPVINKIDLSNADIARAKDELTRLIGCDENEILLVSGKTGQGVPGLLQKIIETVPPPLEDSQDKPLRALIFDSLYDDYRGVVAYLRVVAGTIKKGDKIHLIGGDTDGEALEVGIFSPKLIPKDILNAGEIGYVVSGLKDLKKCRVGDTITHYQSGGTHRAIEPLPGYKEITPMVFAGIFPKQGDEFQSLRDALERLSLNDAAFSYEPEHSSALGYGFRCGFLGLLHLEIMEERLRREYMIEVVTTVPSVGYKIVTTRGEEIVARGATEYPDQTVIKETSEPWVSAQIITPKEFMGTVMPLLQEKRGVFINTEYLGQASTGTERMILHYELPLAAILTDFYDRLKSASSGYASLSYELIKYRQARVVKLDIHVAEDDVPALATIVYEDDAYQIARKIVSSLKDVLPRQQFEIKVQGLIGGKIIASDRVAAFRKDVTGYLYGGDVTRKMKLLEKQKKGKKKMMARGKGAVDIPPEAYLAVLKR